MRAANSIPATRLLTVYRFNGPLALPYYDVDRFVRSGPGSPAGTLAQGSAVVPCLIIRDGRPVTDAQGTPYVGFDVVIDAARATPASVERFKEIDAQRDAMMVADHHCTADKRHVIHARVLYALDKPPSFDPPPPQQASTAPAGRTELDRIVRAFHASRDCDAVNRKLTDRRDALQRAWSTFTTANTGRWPAESIARARHLDFVMRTALYEGHLGRGCNAYGACERNLIALSIRNRAVERCLRGQGCRSDGDFEGVASEVSQYNIWDELLTQTTGLTSCFLRADLAGRTPYGKLQALYEQSAPDIERILFGGVDGLRSIFDTPPAELMRLRHYFHPPAMGKCFPNHRRLEYITAAVASRGTTYALIVNTRIHVGEKRGRDYLFQQATVSDEGERDVVTLLDRYPGFVIDGRKVELKPATRCTPHGVPKTCGFDKTVRYRKSPSWLDDGHPLPVTCRVRARGEDCTSPPREQKITVGGRCDRWMQPVAGVR